MKKIVKNDEGQIVPEKCDKCGSDVVLQIHGEPVYVCKKCGKYFGTMPCNLKESKTKKNMKKQEKLNEAQLRKIIAENIKLVIREWAEPDSGEFYPGKYIYYPEDGKIVGDMSYEINDIAELAENTPEGVVNGIKEYFEDDYANWEDERDTNAPVVLYVMSANGSVIGNTYYISSLDAEYAGEIQAKLGAGAKVVSVNPANNISESKTKKNMKKNIVKINENILRQIVAESVKKALNEVYDFSSEKPQYDINSDEYGREYDKGVYPIYHDDDDITNKEISDYEALPDKARHPYGSEFPDFSERIKNRSKFGYDNDSMIHKSPNEILKKQEEKRNFERLLSKVKNGSLLFHLWCSRNNIDKNKLSDEELVKYYVYCMEEFREREERRTEEYDY